MFDSLSDRLQGALGDLRKKGRLDEESISRAMREIRLALLEADVKGLRLSGFVAWVTWLVVHLWYLVGFQNRLIVVVRWCFSFLTHGRGSRLITSAKLPEALP